MSTMAKEPTSIDQKKFDDTAAIFKALAHPLRLKLVCGLLNEPRTQSQISRAMDIPQSTLAQHLAVLRRENIVEGTRKQGAEVILRVVDERIIGIFDAVCPGRADMIFEWNDDV